MLVIFTRALPLKSLSMLYIITTVSYYILLKVNKVVTHQIKILHSLILFVFRFFPCIKEREGDGYKFLSCPTNRDTRIVCSCEIATCKFILDRIEFVKNEVGFIKNMDIETFKSALDFWLRTVSDQQHISSGYTAKRRTTINSVTEMCH